MLEAQRPSAGATRSIPVTEPEPQLLNPGRSGRAAQPEPRLLNRGALNRPTPAAQPPPPLAPNHFPMDEQRRSLPTAALAIEIRTGARCCQISAMISPPPHPLPGNQLNETHSGFRGLGRVAMNQPSAIVAKLIN